MVIKDNILCGDANRAIQTFATDLEIQHIALNTKKKQRVKHGIYHIQNVNSCHRELKGRINRLRGVATKYLDNYLQQSTNCSMGQWCCTGLIQGNLALS